MLLPGVLGRGVPCVVGSVALTLAALLAGCSRRAAPEPEPEAEATKTPAIKPAPPRKGAGSVPDVPEPRIPRRLLFIHLSKYAFLNPLTASKLGTPDHTRAAAMRLAFEWHVPTDRDNNQVFVLSDTAPPPDNHTPYKSVIVGTYEQFFETSRAQDRIVVYLGGHAIEIAGRAYFAPIEGDPDNPDTLIPIERFYGKLAACKATQKVVIWDVCRYNPERGRQRPGSEPMSESLARALATVPDGVEVVTTCQPGQNALEFYNLQIEPTANAPISSGSVFLESMKYLSEKSQSTTKAPKAADPIPVAAWASAVGARVTTMATAARARQTVHLGGRMRETQTAPNPTESAARRFETPTTPKGIPVADIKAIESEFHVPPIKPAVTDDGLADLLFQPEVMKAYKSDVSIEEIRKNKEKYRFRVVSLDAFQTLRDLWKVAPGKGNLQLREQIAAPVTDPLKRAIKKEQEVWGIGIARLEQINMALDEVARMKDGQPKRWQAHHEYARAVVKARLAFMNEYNKAMGDVLTETLPPLDKMLKQDHYQLVASEKMKSKKDVQKLAEEAQEAYAILFAEHKGTPWAIQAQREKGILLGLSWRPAPSAKPAD